MQNISPLKTTITLGSLVHGLIIMLNKSSHRLIMQQLLFLIINMLLAFLLIMQLRLRIDHLVNHLK